MSATLGNPEMLRRWLDAEPVSDYRPVPLFQWSRLEQLDRARAAATVAAAAVARMAAAALAQASTLAQAVSCRLAERERAGGAGSRGSLKPALESTGICGSGGSSSQQRRIPAGEELDAVAFTAMEAVAGGREVLIFCPSKCRRGDGEVVASYIGRMEQRQQQQQRQREENERAPGRRHRRGGRPEARGARRAPRAARREYGGESRPAARYNRPRRRRTPRGLAAHEKKCMEDAFGVGRSRCSSRRQPSRASTCPRGARSSRPTVGRIGPTTLWWLPANEYRQMAGRAGRAS